MADYNEWNCPHGIHAGEYGSCDVCWDERQRELLRRDQAKARQRKASVPREGENRQEEK